jgi:hypothetical protein
VSLARELAAALATDGVDRGDPAAVRAWIQDLHLRPPEGAAALTAELASLDGPVTSMGPVLLAPRRELEADARAALDRRVRGAADDVDHPLPVWEAAVSATLTRAAVTVPPPDRPWAGTVAERVVEFLVLLYAGRRQVVVAEALESLWSDVAVERDLDLDDRAVVAAWLRGMRVELDEVLADLAELGVVALSPDGAVAMLTDLGVFAVNRLLVASGVDAPVAGEWAEADAETMLTACLHLDPAHADLEVDLWVERRGERAVWELVAVVRDTVDPAVRSLALDALDLFGPEVDARLAALPVDLVVWPSVAAWLTMRARR